MSDQNYGEILCQAVDEIVRTRLEGVSYDQTILCTIVDDSRREEGIYTVTNNNRVRFDAVSNDASYRKHNNVYVQIPGGDWNQQKIILAKKTESAEDPFIYKRPFDTFVDITGNLIKNSKNNYGLSANDDRTEFITLWTYNVDNLDSEIKSGGNSFSAYTRLGIQASFQSLLNSFYDEVTETEYNVDQGDYGLRLFVVTANEGTSKEDAQVTTYTFYLNCADMNGNPYDFQAYYLQEKVFDISDLGPIQSMRLDFYQTPGSFKASRGEDGILFPTNTDPFEGSMPINNLFINSDIFISLGYDTSDFADEKVVAYTLNSTTFSREANPLSNNHKDLQLRWLHKEKDGTIVSIDSTNDTGIDYEIRWYRFELGHSSADEYSSYYWKNLLTQRRRRVDDIASDKLFIDDKWVYEIYDESWLKYNDEAGSAEMRKPSYGHAWLIPDITVDTEQVKAIILYNDIPYRSNTVLCTNEDEVVNKATVDAVQALSIFCDDESYGNYHCYTVGGTLLDSAQGKLKRTWTPYFKLSKGGTDDAPPEVLIEAEQIEWIIPTKNTMIDLGVNAYPQPVAAGEKVDLFDGDTAIGYYYYDDKDNDNLHIVRYGAGVAGNELIGRNTQDYYIKSYCSQTYNNNTIKCKIIKSKITYTAVHEMTFGSAGTSGADCTLVLDFVGNQTAILPGKTVQVVARLYDYENKEIKIFSEKQRIDWSWRNPDQSTTPKMTIENKERMSCMISLNGTIGPCYNILQATLRNWGRGDVVAYLPIPIALESSAYISGTTTVLYSSSGEAMSYFQNPYTFYNEYGKVDGVTWRIINKDPNISSQYVPKLVNDRLAPLSFYVKDACDDNCVVAEKNGQIIWSQPILIEQNRYPSTTIGAWSGELDVGETEKGTILAPRIAAGRKNYDNTFNGVIIGDWQKDADLPLTGIYGYKDGQQTFALKENGTAFMGSNSGSRIEFNGEESTIKSANYKKDLSGMLIDLDDGIMSMSSLTGSITLNTQADPEKGTPEFDDYPFAIGKNFRVAWDGSAWMNNGTFSGHLEAASGTFSGDLDAAGGTFKGNLSAAGGSFTGTLDVGDHFKVNEKGEITATGGTIGGWTIGQHSISAGGLILNDTGVISGSNLEGQLSAFELSNSGVTIRQGTIGDGTVEEGKIKEITIQKPSIKSGTIYGSSITLGTEGPDGTNYFTATCSEDGKTAVVGLSGTIYCEDGKIGGWSIGPDGLSGQDITLSKGAITAGTEEDKYFSVTNTGVLTAKGANIEGVLTVSKGGKIGAWEVTEDGALQGSGIVLKSGSITAGTVEGGTTYFSVSGEGTLKAKNAEIEGKLTVTNGGKIGDWTIAGGTLTGGGITLAPGLITVGSGETAAVSISSTGAFTAGKFSVDSSGNIEATGAKLTSCEVTNTLKFGDAACSLKKLTVTQSIGVGTQTVGLNISGDQKIKIPALTFDKENTSVTVKVNVTGNIKMPTSAYLTGQTVQIKDKDGNLLGSVWEPDVAVNFNETLVPFSASGTGTGKCSGQTLAKDDVNITLNVTGNDINFNVPVVLEKPVTTEIYYLAASDESISFTAGGGSGGSGGIINNPPRKDFSQVQMQ